MFGWTQAWEWGKGARLGTMKAFQGIVGMVFGTACSHGALVHTRAKVAKNERGRIYRVSTNPTERNTEASNPTIRGFWWVCAENGRWATPGSLSLPFGFRQPLTRRTKSDVSPKCVPSARGLQVAQKPTRAELVNHPRGGPWVERAAHPSSPVLPFEEYAFPCWL